MRESANNIISKYLLYHPARVFASGVTRHYPISKFSADFVRRARCFSPQRRQ
ncbi:hypothetical protein PUN28_010642 [Cardiocondyla obscurior]|uniref:Uncharacterized protein n=1 Tax=Cardiocondyla obscurior TaxID=286306 RepID=A0AAW2FMH2_9HYME